MTLWTPSNYTAGVLREWHDPSNSANITQSAGLVSADADLSGNGFTDTASTTARPTLTTSAINGLDAETFNGTSNYFVGGTIGTSPPYGIACVIQRSTAATIRDIIGSGASAGIELRLETDHRLSLVVQFVILVGDSGANVVPTTPSIVAMQYDNVGGAWSVRINGSVSGSGTNARSITPNATNVGRNGSSAGNFWDNLIGERIHLLNSTTTNIQLAEGYLAWKWGTVSTLDSAHPYKGAAPTIVFPFPRNRHYVRR
jgi:hypothetical protein